MAHEWVMSPDGEWDKVVNGSLVLTSPNGNRYSVMVDDAGALSMTNEKTGEAVPIGGGSDAVKLAITAYPYESGCSYECDLPLEEAMTLAKEKGWDALDIRFYWQDDLAHFVDSGEYFPYWMSFTIVTFDVKTTPNGDTPQVDVYTVKLSSKKSSGGEGFTVTKEGTIALPT